MKIKTSISATKNNEHSIRDTSLTELIANNTFIEVVFLLLRGTLPSKNEEILLNALLVGAVEHGADVPSIFAPRVSIASGGGAQSALAAGILSIGSKHGGAGWDAAYLLATSKTPVEIVAEYISLKKAIPGFGHALYIDSDPRVTVIEKKISSLRLPRKYFDKAKAIEKELAKEKDKHIPLNIDGAFAACLLDLDFPTEAALELFILARMAGMSAHINEERKQNNPYYRLNNN
jgi:citrate synthase